MFDIRLMHMFETILLNHINKAQKVRPYIVGKPGNFFLGVLVAVNDNPAAWRIIYHIWYRFASREISYPQNLPCYFGIVERQNFVTDDLTAFVTLAGDDQNVIW